MNYTTLEGIKDNIPYIHNVSNMRSPQIAKLPAIFVEKFANAASGAMFIADNVPDLRNEFGTLAVYLEDIVDMLNSGQQTEAQYVFFEAEVSEFAKDALQKLASEFFRYYDGGSSLLFGYNLRHESGYTDIDEYGREVIIDDDNFDHVLDVVDEIAELLNPYD